MTSIMWKGEEIPRPELDWCAHCGCKAEYVATFPTMGDNDSSEWARVHCTGCSISTPMITINWKLDQPYHEALNRVAAIWNRRFQ